jgi:putative restriction endonuclease
VSSDRVTDEFNLRLGAWRDLIERGGPADVDRALIRELKMYGGAQGVWVDADRTRLVSEGASGVAVGLLHTGRHYADDLSPTGILYHYPRTNRGVGRDASEVTATKRAAELALPVFVVTPSTKNRNRRDVHMGWVVDWDDADEVFLVTFTDELVPSTPSNGGPHSHLPFKLLDGDAETRRVEVAARPNQQRFKFDVLARYGAACAVCDIDVRELLDAVHIAEKSKRGTDHAENGLVLCANHHRAYDRGLFCVEPGTLAIRLRQGNRDLQLSRDSLTHLKDHPHSEALTWRWERWRNKGADAAAT